MAKFITEIDMPISKSTGDAREFKAPTIALPFDSIASESGARNPKVLSDNIGATVDRVTDAIAQSSNGSSVLKDDEDREYVSHLLQTNGFGSFDDFQNEATSRIIFLRLAPADYRELLEYATLHYPGDYIANIGRQSVKGRPAKSFASARYLRAIFIEAFLRKEISSKRPIPMDEAADNTSYVRSLLYETGFSGIQSLEQECQHRAVYLRLAPDDYHEVIEYIGRHYPKINRSNIGQQARNGNRTFAAPSFLIETSLRPTAAAKLELIRDVGIELDFDTAKTRLPQAISNTPAEILSTSVISTEISQAAAIFAGRLPNGYWSPQRRQALIALRYDEGMDDSQIAAFVGKFSGYNISEATISFHIDEAKKKMRGQSFMMPNSGPQDIPAIETKYGKIFTLNDREKAIAARRILNDADKPKTSVVTEGIAPELKDRVEAQRFRLTRYARALTRDRDRADDLAQDTITRALNKIHLWKEGTDLRAWLFTILHNQYVSMVRRSAREGMHVEIDRAAEIGRTGTVVDEVCSSRLEASDLLKGLSRLPADQREVILMVGYEGLRYEQAAAELGIPVGTVRSRLSRGRDALRRLTDRDGADEDITPMPLEPRTRRPHRTWNRWQINR